MPAIAQPAVIPASRFAERFNLCRSLVTGALLQHGLIAKDDIGQWQITLAGARRGGTLTPGTGRAPDVAFPLETFRDTVSLRLLRSSAAGADTRRLDDDTATTPAHLTHTEIAAQLELPAAELIGILSELGWIQRAPAGGWTPGPIGHLHGAQHAVAADGKATVRWPAGVLDNPHLRMAAAEFHQPGESHPFPSADTFACLDGHRVRCRSEVVIDNWLYHHEVPHAYGRPVPAGDDTPLISGFYLPAAKVYIEFWRFGIDPDSAIEVHQKRALYRLYRCRLIELTPAHLGELDTHLAAELGRHGVTVPAFA